MLGASGTQCCASATGLVNSQSKYQKNICFLLIAFTCFAHANTQRLGWHPEPNWELRLHKRLMNHLNQRLQIPKTHTHTPPMILAGWNKAFGVPVSWTMYNMSVIVLNPVARCPQHLLSKVMHKHDNHMDPWIERSANASWNKTSSNLCRKKNRSNKFSNCDSNLTSPKLGRLRNCCIHWCPRGIPHTSWLKWSFWNSSRDENQPKTFTSW